MQVTREIADPKIARFVQNASEEELRTAMEDLAADAELNKAVEYSLAHDDPRKSIPPKTFLASIGHGSPQGQSL